MPQERSPRIIFAFGLAALVLFVSILVPYKRQIRPSGPQQPYSRMSQAVCCELVDGQYVAFASSPFEVDVPHYVFRWVVTVSDDERNSNWLESSLYIRPPPTSELSAFYSVLPL